MCVYKNLVIVPALALTLAAPYGYAYDREQLSREPRPEEIAVDGLVARPLGLVSAVVGAATWLVTLPFSLTSGSTDRAAKKLIAEPLQYTFRRPLGQYDTCQTLPESCVHETDETRVTGPSERPGRM
jgi:hypothetical protein